MPGLARGKGAEDPEGKALAGTAEAGMAGKAGGPTGENGPRIYSITQYNKSVERKMREFPRVWVKGVITQLNVRGRIAYVSIGEFEEGDARPKAVLDTTLWTSQLEMFNLRLASLPTPLTLRVELKVAFLLESNFYVPTGRFQPRIVDVDEKFTLGELAITRQKILEKLMKEGLLGKNKERPLADPALRVGLVTAPGSAAYRDFTTVLLGSGFSFQITFAPAKMQGEATEATVVHALELLSVLPLDVICIVRGGGSKTDLVYFDSEAICRAIANCPIPVLTGIGHEIDNSLADLVAHADKITPTDCAKFLEGLALNCLARLNAYAGNIAEAWRMEFQEAWHESAQRASVLRRAWESRRVTEDLRCREQYRLLASSAKRTLREERKSLKLDSVGLTRGPAKILRMEKLRFRNRSQGLGHGWARWRDARGQSLRESLGKLRDGARRLAAAAGKDQAAAARRLAEKARADLERGASALAPLRRLLRGAWTQNARSATEGLALKERLVHAADPARMLELGFSMLRRADGKAIRGVADVKAGDKVVNVLKDGTVESTVTGSEEKG
jgi:exodeoxyribonuclease VII large subunit